jgi:hypothetical protein
MADDWKLTPEDESAWQEFFPDELDRERWRTNFGKDPVAAEDAAYWRDMVPGIEPSIAAIYKKEGMSVYDVGDWQQAEFNDYKEVLGWKRVNATPEVAMAFKAKGVNHDTYEKWAKIGIDNPDVMLKFSEDMKLGIGDLERHIKPLIDSEKLELNELPKWLEAGIPIQEIGSWVDADFKYPSIVKAWKMLHFKPAEAREWEKVVNFPREAAKWIGAGYRNIDDVKGLIKQGYTSPEQIEAEVENVMVKS